MPVAQLPAQLVGKLRNVAGLVFDDNGQCTYTTLTTPQTLILALYGATTGGAAVQVPPTAAPALAPSVLQISSVNTSVATTSALIDAAVFPASANVAPTDGVVVHDPTNKLTLTRQAGKWYKSAAGTLIA